MKKKIKRIWITLNCVKIQKKKNLFEERHRIVNIWTGKIDVVKISDVCEWNMSFSRITFVIFHDNGKFVCFINYYNFPTILYLWRNLKYLNVRNKLGISPRYEETNEVMREIEKCNNEWAGNRQGRNLLSAK